MCFCKFSFSGRDFRKRRLPLLLPALPKNLLRFGFKKMLFHLRIRCRKRKDAGSVESSGRVTITGPARGQSARTITFWRYIRIFTIELPSHIHVAHNNIFRWFDLRLSVTKLNVSTRSIENRKTSQKFRGARIQRKTLTKCPIPSSNERVTRSTILICRVRVE